MKKLLALMAAALLVLLTACSASGGERVATTSKNGETTTTEKGEDPSKTTTTEGEDPEPEPEPDPDPKPTTTTKKGGGGVEVAAIGFTAYRDYDEKLTATAGAELENSGDLAANVEVIFTFKDKAGKVVGTDTGYVNAIDADATGYAEVDMVKLQGEPATVEAVAVVDPDAVEYFDGIVIPVTVTSVEIDQYSGAVVAGTAKNPGDDIVESGSVTCVLTTDGGTILGGASAYLDTLTPGAEVTWETYGSPDGLKATKARCAGASY